MRSVRPQPSCGIAVVRQEREHVGRSVMLWAAARVAKAVRMRVFFIMGIVVIVPVERGKEGELVREANKHRDSRFILKQQQGIC